MAVFTVKKLAFLFNLKTAVAHAVCYNVLALFTLICLLLLADIFPAALTLKILLFTRTGKMTACAFLNEFIAARIGERFYFIKFRAAVTAYFRVKSKSNMISFSFAKFLRRCGWLGGELLKSERGRLLASAFSSCFSLFFFS